MLDVGDDDYYKTGRDDIVNIEFSPLLEGPAGERGDLPVGLDTARSAP